jgi:catechol-2,3-dioxygenase
MEILELKLATNDLAQTENFYREVLEFPVQEKSSSMVQFQVGITNLAFEYSNNSGPFYHFAFTIPQNKLEKALRWIEKKNISIIPVHGAKKIAGFTANARSFYFFDNNKNILEFIVRPDLNISSSEPFSSASIVCISEIGLVCENVKEESERIRHEYNVPVFTKWKPNDHFIPQGDDNGLFIIVGEGRHWYPTEIPAEKFPVSVKFRSEEKVYEINL